MSELKWQTRDEMDYPTNPLQKLAETLTGTSQDCGEDKMIAFLYGVIVGWSDASYAELKEKHNWSDESVLLQKMWHSNYNKAWELFIQNNTNPRNGDNRRID